jgi:DNA-binding NtrC family response regulator
LISLSFAFFSLENSQRNSKNFSPICPRAVIDFWRRSILFKIESGAFWGEKMLSGAKQNRSLRSEKKRF